MSSATVEQPVSAVVHPVVLRRFGFVRDHPVLVPVAVALAVRLVFALVSFAVHQPLLIPDEGNYLSLGAWVARGADADSWQPGYGQSLYDHTWAFIAPIVQLFKLFGISRLWGQLVAVGAGVATVAVGAAFARRVLGRDAAVVVGLGLALLPSQVLFSSVAIRESMVWLGLTTMALGLSFADDRRHLAAGLGFAGAVAGLVVVGLLRDQTAVAAAWALPLCMFIVPSRRRVAGLVGATMVALVVPLMTGSGLGGSRLVEHAIPGLARLRAVNALDAESSFRDSVAVPTTTTTPRGGGDVDTPGTPTTVDPVTTTTLGEREFIQADGKLYELDDASVAASLRSAPRGLEAILVRPYPWESTGSVGSSMARAENLLWYALYVLAALGAVALGRGLRVLAFPLVLTVAIILAAAVSQGNVGTAFRHRGQVAWALLLFASVGIARLAEIRARRTSRDLPV